MTDPQRPSEQDYDALKRAVEAAGFFADFQPIDVPGDRMCVASEKFENGVTGVLFWIAKRGARWFVATWADRLYSVPENQPVEAFVIEALRVHRGTPHDFKPELKAKYGLAEVTEEDFDRA
jgi:hypothetical protein